MYIPPVCSVIRRFDAVIVGFNRNEKYLPINDTPRAVFRLQGFEILVILLIGL